MKQRRIISLSLMAFSLILGGCGRNFPTYLEKAREAFGNQSYVKAVDAALLALPRWKSKHGEKAKAEAYQILGLSYQKMGRVENALEALSQAVDLSDDTYPAAIELGFLHLTRGEGKMAIKTFQKALRMKPDAPMALLGLGNAFFKQKNYEMALLNFNRVLDVSPGVREAMDSIGLIKKRIRRPRSTR